MSWDRKLHLLHYLTYWHLHHKTDLSSRYGEVLKGSLKEGEEVAGIIEQKIKVPVSFDLLVIHFSLIVLHRHIRYGLYKDPSFPQQELDLPLALAALELSIFSYHI